MVRKSDLCALRKFEDDLFDLYWRRQREVREAAMTAFESGERDWDFILDELANCRVDLNAYLLELASDVVGCLQGEGLSPIQRLVWEIVHGDLEVCVDEYLELSDAGWLTSDPTAALEWAFVRALLLEDRGASASEAIRVAGLKRGPSPVDADLFAGII